MRLFLVFAFVGIMVGGCRSSKSVESHVVVADSLSVRKNFEVSASCDSVAVTERYRNASCDEVEFVDMGGVMVMSADGSVSLSGVSSFRSGRITSAEMKEDMESTVMKWSEEDSLESVSERDRTVMEQNSDRISAGGGGFKWLLWSGTGVFIILIAVRLWQRLKR